MKWTRDQDTKLTEMVLADSCDVCVNQYRADCPCETFKKKGTWEKYAKVIKTTYGSCQARWCANLDPMLRNEPWTKEEDDLLLSIYKSTEWNTWSKRAVKLQEINANQKRRNGGDVAKRYFELTKSTGKRKKISE